MGLLDNKVVIITGAASGMGAAEARLFDQEGAKLALLDINGEKLNEVAQSLRQEAIVLKTDVSNVDEVNHAVETVLKKYGTIDVVSNTGGVFDKNVPLLDTDEDLLDRIYGVDAKGVYYMMKAVLPEMLKKGKGVFVNVASVAGLVGNGGGFAYTTAKSAVIGMTRSVATAYKGQGIRANALCPAMVSTPMTAESMKDQSIVDYFNTVSGRVGTPEDIATVALFLASDLSAYINGVALPVDGGFMAQ